MHIPSRLLVAPTLAPATRETLTHDLEQFPEPWLDFLDSYGVQVVALSDGQTLADSPAVGRWAVADLPEKIESTSAQLGAALAQTPPATDELERYQQKQQLKEAIHGWLSQTGSPFRLATHEQPVDLAGLAELRRVPADRRQEWQSSLQALNAPWSEVQADGLHTKHGLLLLPPIPTAHGSVPDQPFQNALDTTAAFVERSLGLNRGSDQLVLLHEKFLPADAPEIGDYRVGIHEVGHALDYALEGLPDSTGFGQLHKARVKELFTRPQEFTSDRADDDVREYFAEGVEAYLTPAGTGTFRQANNRDHLKTVNPELFAYLDHIFQTVPGPDWVSQPPKPVTVPEGFPDPDRDPLELP